MLRFCLLLAFLPWQPLAAKYVRGNLPVADASPSGEPRPSFAAFVQKHGRAYGPPGSQEYTLRQALFEKRVAEVEDHNRNADRSWQAVVNKLADRTDDELARLRGWRGSARPGRSSAHHEGEGSQPIQLFSTDAVAMQLPREHSWTNLTTVKEIQDQGGCGSCWAFASATVLRAHSEIWMKDARRFSVQQIVSCTANPKECGGTGGCNGATAELAMDYVFKHGCRTELEMPYTEQDTACPTNLMDRDSPAVNGGTAIGMLGWTKLPENKLGPLKLALVSKGPVAVSISAGYSWNQYGGGILDNCPKDAIIDHAVVLIGYGEDKSESASSSKEATSKYWQLQNSWGRDWGEDGLIRMVRKEDEETTHCGWDNDPQIGSGCKGGPPQVYVCGMCGLLYDTVIPHFASKQSLVDVSPHHAPHAKSLHATSSFLSNGM